MLKGFQLTSSCNTLQQNRLDPNGIVSQEYDGASVMSGCCSGMQQRIRQVAPKAIYVHCYAHCLNLIPLKQYQKHLSSL